MELWLLTKDHLEKLTVHVCGRCHVFFVHGFGREVEMLNYHHGRCSIKKSMVVASNCDEESWSALRCVRFNGQQGVTQKDFLYRKPISVTLPDEFVASAMRFKCCMRVCDEQKQSTGPVQWLRLKPISILLCKRSHAHRVKPHSTQMDLIKIHSIQFFYQTVNVAHSPLERSAVLMLVLKNHQRL